MKTIIFLHGFFTSGSCILAKTLKETFESIVQHKARVITPDLPIYPKEALKVIRELCDKEKPDLLIGNSCGSFYAQIVAPLIGVPALLGNPHFKLTEFLKAHIGKHEYKSPRADGNQFFTIDESLIADFAELESHQFDCTNPYYKDKVWGIFGERDSLAHFEPTFLEHYNNAYHFPGAHTPTADEVKTWYIPLIQKMLMTYHIKEERYFYHFKGNKYKYLLSAFDSETQERMVLYQALYGTRGYWVRPEKMFFEKVIREGKTFNRFTEIEE